MDDRITLRTSGPGTPGHSTRVQSVRHSPRVPRHGSALMEQAKRTHRKFEARIRIQKCVETGFNWFGSGKGVGHMEMTPIREGMVHHGSNLDFEPTQKNLGCDFNFPWVGLISVCSKWLKQRFATVNLLRRGLIPLDEVYHPVGFPLNPIGAAQARVHPQNL